MVLVPDSVVIDSQRDSRIRANCVIRIGYHYKYSDWVDAEAKGTIRQDEWALQPALTRTYRQVRKETLPVYYGANDFVTDADDKSTYPPWVNEIGFPHALKWLRAIGPENRSFLTTVTIRGGPLTTRFVSARRFLALMAKGGIHLPEGIVASVYDVYTVVDQRGRLQHDYVQATPQIEEEHSHFGDEPGVY